MNTSSGKCLPTVSVLMAVRDEAKYIRNSVESILNQTFGNFEFIIVDDQSKDETVEIIRGFNDERIILVEGSGDGLAAALNKGLARCRGEFIARMDGDDISLPCRLQKQYEYMKKWNRVDLLGSQAEIIDETGCIVGKYIKPIDERIIRKAAKYGCPIIHPSYFGRKNLFISMNGYREKFTYAQDYDFILRALDKNSTIHNIDEVLIYYRFVYNKSRATKNYLQMYYTKLALQLHQCRVKFGYESKIIEVKLNKRFDGEMRYFYAVDKIRSFLLNKSSSSGRILKYLFIALAFCISIMHYQVLQSMTRAFFYKVSCHGGGASLDS